MNFFKLLVYCPINLDCVVEPLPLTITILLYPYYPLLLIVSYHFFHHTINTEQLLCLLDLHDSFTVSHQFNTHQKAHLYHYLIFF